MDDLLEKKITILPGARFPKSPMLPLDPEDIAAVHTASIEVLSTTGVRFASEAARSIFRNHGFRVEGETVYITENDVTRALEKVTKEFTILARNPAHNIRLRHGSTSFGMGRTAVFMVEPDGNCRSSGSEDFLDAVKLFQQMDLLEHYNPLVFPNDIDPVNVNLWMCRMMIEHTDKPAMYIDRHDIGLIALSYGTTPEEMMLNDNFEESFGITTVMATSPLSFGAGECENIIAFAKHAVAFHTASMPIAAVTSPCTLAGTVVQQNCENLAPLVLAQLVRPGCPVFYGAIGGAADMRTLRPRFGSADAMTVERAGAQMARSYGLLCRGGAGLTDSPSCDFQAGSQAMLNTLSVIYDGPNFVPACGLLGSYIGASLAKVVLDQELIVQAVRFLEPLRTDQVSLAVDVIRDTGPGGHFISHPHTLDNFRSSLHTESLFQSPDYGTWLKGGKKDTVHLAHEKALSLIASYEKPPMDQGLAEEIREYEKRHKGQVNTGT